MQDTETTTSTRDNASGHGAMTREKEWFITHHAADRMVKRFPELLSKKALLRYRTYKFGPKELVMKEMKRLAAKSKKCRELNSKVVGNRAIRYYHNNDLVFVINLNAQCKGKYVSTVVSLKSYLSTFDQEKAYRQANRRAGNSR